MAPRWHAALASVFALVAFRPTAWAHEPVAPIDEVTRERLESRELVISPVDERRGPLRLLGGTSMKVLEFEPEVVWRALEETPDLGVMLPGDTTVRETYRQGPERGAYVRHEYGPVEATYHVRIRYDVRSRLMVFQLDPQHETRLRAGWGFVQVSPWPGGRSLVRYGALVDVGSGLVSGLMRPALHRAILSVPRTIEEHLRRCAIGREDEASCPGMPRGDTAADG